MTTDKERLVSVNNWNVMWVDYAIQYLKHTKAQFEIFETLGSKTADMIDDFITKLECLQCNYKIEEEN